MPDAASHAQELDDNYHVNSANVHATKQRDHSQNAQLDMIGEGRHLTEQRDEGEAEHPNSDAAFVTPISVHTTICQSLKVLLQQ